MNTADRTYFGQNVWGASERHRSSVYDWRQINRFKLPPLQTELELAHWLGITLPKLRWFTHDLLEDAYWHYTRYTIAKRSGGEREILAPKSELKALQRRVLHDMLARVPAAEPAHGFVPRRSIVTNARNHVAHRYLLRLDLKDFFPSITFPRVRGIFIDLGYSFAVASTLALLCTEYKRKQSGHSDTPIFVAEGARHLVQGAPTSPAIANMVVRRLDRRLAGLAGKYRVAYSRYADDLTFSGSDFDRILRLSITAQKIVEDEGFAVNETKTHIAPHSSRQVVTGIVVNDKLSVRRNLRRRLRAILRNAEKTGLASQNRDNHPNFRAYLEGMIAFINAVDTVQAMKLRDSFDRVLTAGLTATQTSVVYETMTPRQTTRSTPEPATLQPPAPDLDMLQPPVRPGELQLGDRVIHPSLGPGVVIELRNYDKDVMVQFGGNGVSLLDVKYAKLRRPAADASS